MANSKTWLSECRKKAQAGDPEAQLRLAIAYANGIGVQQNDSNARKWLNLAVTSPNLQRALSKYFSRREGAIPLPKRVADLKRPRIQWKECKTIPEWLGHGVNFVDPRRTEAGATVAWLEGFEWFDGFPKTVKIDCLAPDSITTATDLAAMKIVMTLHILTKTVPECKITPHIEAHVQS